MAEKAFCDKVLWFVSEIFLMQKTLCFFKCKRGPKLFNVKV